VGVSVNSRWKLQEFRGQNPGFLLQNYLTVRDFFRHLCDPLQTEDYVIQSMADASPAKWHLAHTTWFFETFYLPLIDPEYRPLHPDYRYLFNSYYNAVGPQFPRPKRGLLSRPTVEEVWRYRTHVDETIRSALASSDARATEESVGILALGLNHEQQHQELFLTDIKHAFFCNPLRPVYSDRIQSERWSEAQPVRWKEYPEGLHWIGHGGQEFAFDNEMPRFKVFCPPFRIADRLVNNTEYLEFIEDNGYRRPELWLSAGWDAVLANNWEAPQYWEKREGIWLAMTLSGMRLVDGSEPVCHVSFFEADAYARWAGARLPTEFEWEVASADRGEEGGFAEDGEFHPRAPQSISQAGKIAHMTGNVWEWTGSAYTAYPGYRTTAGALGEYNGKFMCNQLVLRGGSCATPRSHIRPTYRNFFPPEARWQFSGIRLAGDAE
jgi:ergothioneine biosynthesis protein EgtB